VQNVSGCDSSCSQPGFHGANSKLNTREHAGIHGRRRRRGARAASRPGPEWEGSFEWIGARTATGTVNATYSETGNGSAVVENLAMDGVPAMTSVYHLDGADLLRNSFRQFPGGLTGNHGCRKVLFRFSERPHIRHC
jgi:hypothetical protein